jgi:hypothetical protein
MMEHVELEVTTQTKNGRPQPEHVHGETFTVRQDGLTSFILYEVYLLNKRL